ncbi:hypothetical protein [Campylobacter rectus]|uniref:hypothetical protein n=1 Tax=Campylobacter rectus TaxID=203 RepID=UPI000F5F498D|nr:hypothetical protein [Campylobacter rectus]RRD53558.1 hypothetical protein EII16_08430 [Campylobacter rectus]
MQYKIQKIKNGEYRVFGRDYDAVHLVDEAGAKAIAAELEAKWLAEQKLLKIAKLNANINAAYQAYLKKYPDVEIRTFEEKAKESFLAKKDPQTPCVDTPLLCKLTANGTVEERNILAGQVFEKVLENAALEKWGVVTRDAIKAASDEAALDQISIEIPNLGEGNV